MKHVETQCAEKVNFEFVNVNKIFIMQQAVSNLLFLRGKYIYCSLIIEDWIIAKIFPFISVVPTLLIFRYFSTTST